MAENHLVLTAVGADRPGLIDAISKFVFDRGGNVEASRAATLGGAFAVIMLISSDADSAQRMQREIDSLTDGAELTCTLQPTTAQAQAEAGPMLPFSLTVHCMDHPGIVLGVARELANLGVNIVSLDTHVESAPHTGTAFFHVHARLHVPAEFSLPAFREQLEALGERLNVDVQLEAGEDEA